MMRYRGDEEGGGGVLGEELRTADLLGPRIKSLLEGEIVDVGVIFF
jgi:hypothetical protein